LFGTLRAGGFSRAPALGTTERVVARRFAGIMAMTIERQSGKK
jgi:hypothetical protein